MAASKRTQNGMGSAIDPLLHGLMRLRSILPPFCKSLGSIYIIWHCIDCTNAVSRVCIAVAIPFFLGILLMLQLQPPFSGKPGTVTRRSYDGDMPGTVIETAVLTPFDQPNAVTMPGLAVALDASTGMLRALVSTDTTIFGMLVANYPQLPRCGEGPVSVMRRGYMQVYLFGRDACNLAMPVYVRVAGAVGGLCIGGCEAAPDGTNTIPIQAKFTRQADALGLTEICYRLV